MLLGGVVPIVQASQIVVRPKLEVSVRSMLLSMPSQDLIELGCESLERLVALNQSGIPEIEKNPRAYSFLLTRLDALIGPQEDFHLLPAHVSRQKLITAVRQAEVDAMTLAQAAIHAGENLHPRNLDAAGVVINSAKALTPFLPSSVAEQVIVVAERKNALADQLMARHATHIHHIKDDIVTGLLNGHNLVLHDGEQWVFSDENPMRSHQDYPHPNLLPVIEGLSDAPRAQLYNLYLRRIHVLSEQPAGPWTINQLTSVKESIEQMSFYLDQGWEIFPSGYFQTELPSHRLKNKIAILKAEAQEWKTHHPQLLRTHWRAIDGSLSAKDIETIHSFYSRPRDLTQQAWLSAGLEHDTNKYIPPVNQFRKLVKSLKKIYLRRMFIFACLSPLPIYIPSYLQSQPPSAVSIIISALILSLWVVNLIQFWRLSRLKMTELEFVENKLFRKRQD
jgi:hypothetical protein